MKKTKPEALFQRLVKNEISRKEFEELLQGMEDPEVKTQLEASMKEYFDEMLNQYENERKTKAKVNTSVSPDRNNE
ncbi:hypothetical protein [Cyclobacterium lianum]|nr:hypothetical protein [Cyclobacterium lianum]